MATTQARIRITAQDDTAAAFKQASGNIAALQSSALTLAGSLGGALAAGGLASIVTTAIDAVDNLRDLSQTTGVAIQGLGGLGFAASQNGGSLEGVASAAGKLNKTLAEAAAGSQKALEPFRLLGISIQDAAGQTKTADVVFAEVASRFATFADGPEKSALLDQLEVKLDDRGNIARDENFQTSEEGIFVAGDAGRGQSLIVWAIAEGRSAAAAVDRYLTGETQLHAPIEPTTRPLMV